MGLEVFIVRHKLNLQFSGRTYSESIFITDCKIDNLPVGENQISIFLASTGLAGLFPMINDQYRLFGTIQERKKTDGKISIQEAVDILKQRSGLLI
jgi:hypothetical protein